MPSSEASCLRPKTMTTRPSGSNLMTMSEPLSATQILSSRIYLDGMAERPRVEVVANLANELAVGAKLEKLRCSRPVSRTGRIAASQRKDVSLGVDRDSGHLSQIHVRRKLEKIWHRSVVNHRHGSLLREDGKVKQQKR